MSDYGIKVSEDKIDVLTAKSYQLAYSSEFDTLKIYRKGSGTVTITAGTPVTVKIDHQLGYRPAFLFFTEISPSFGSAGEYFLQPFLWPIGGDVSIEAAINPFWLEIRYGGDQAPGTTSYNYRYIIFYNRAAPVWVK